MLLILLQVVTDTAAAAPGASRHRLGLGVIVGVIIAVAIVGARLRQRRAHLRSMERAPGPDGR